jgi:hypothetical protein
MESLHGRRYVPERGVTQYLVAYEGYVVRTCCSFARLTNNS